MHYKYISSSCLRQKSTMETPLIIQSGQDVHIQKGKRHQVLEIEQTHPTRMHDTRPRQLDVKMTNN